MEKSFLKLHIAIFLASCSGIFGKLIHLDAVLTTWYRMLFAFFVMLVILMISKKKCQIDFNQLTTYKIMGAGILLALHWVFFYASIKYSNVSIGVVCFCLSGFFTAVLSPVINKTRLSIVELLLSALTIVGILLIFHFDDSFRFGILMGVISSLIFAVFTIVNEKINQKESPQNVTMLEMLGGAIGIALLLPFYYLYHVEKTHFLPSVSDLFFLLILAILCTDVMYILLNSVQKKISAFTISLSFNLEPIYSIVLAVVLFHEDKDLKLTFYIGLSLIILSLVLQMIRVFYQRKKKQIVG